MTQATCSIEGCDKPVQARGWCGAHYNRWHKHGDPLTITRRSPGPGECSVDGCDKPARSRGWCETHYMRWRTTGDVGPAELLRKPAGSVICLADGCEDPAKTRGYCTKHYHRLVRHGDALAAVRIMGDDESRFWSKVERRGETECWPYTETLNQGYGHFHLGANLVYAHRFSYELLVGPIPDGLELDHLCHTNDPTCPGGGDCPHRACVNPAHLEPVTGLVNTMRGNSPHAASARVTQCPQEHEYTPENTYIDSNGRRRCRTCLREKRIATKEARNEQRRAWRQHRREQGLPVA